MKDFFATHTVLFVDRLIRLGGSLGEKMGKICYIKLHLGPWSSNKIFLKLSSARGVVFDRVDTFR